MFESDLYLGFSLPFDMFSSLPVIGSTHREVELIGVRGFVFMQALGKVLLLFSALLRYYRHKPCKFKVYIAMI